MHSEGCRKVEQLSPEENSRDQKYSGEQRPWMKWQLVHYSHYSLRCQFRLQYSAAAAEIDYKNKEIDKNNIAGGNPNNARHIGRRRKIIQKNWHQENVHYIFCVNNT